MGRFEDGDGGEKKMSRDRGYTFNGYEPGETLDGKVKTSTFGTKTRCTVHLQTFEQIHGWTKYSYLSIS